MDQDSEPCHSELLSENKRQVNESMAEEDRKRAEEEARAAEAARLAAEEAEQERARLEKLARKEARDKARQEK